jgi:hypothetical protein
LAEDAWWHAKGEYLLKLHFSGADLTRKIKINKSPSGLGGSLAALE